MFDFTKLYSIEYNASNKKPINYKKIIKPEAPTRFGTDITVVVEKIYKKSKTNFSKF